MKKTMMCFLIATTMVTFISCGTQDGNKDSAEIAEDQNEERFEDSKLDDDTEFAVEAADGGLLEVQLGTMALTKASSPEVKNFAQMMVDDHSKANNELKALAQQKNITLPSVLGDEHQKKYDDLDKEKGAGFDKAYMDFMVKDHREDIEAFAEQAEEGQDAQLKTWAAAKVVALRQHLEMAERIQESLDNKQ